MSILLRHGSLFSGIGGFDLAAECMGWENIFHCEWNPFGQKVLKYYWPNSISYNDITKTDFTIHRGAIDILTGGFPCQPYSSAGKRLGKEDERHLWPEMCRAIREIQPKWIVGENVLGLVNWNGGMVFEEVQADLEAEGYEIQPYVLPAAAVGAPHRRDRVWFVAYRNAADTESQPGEWMRPKLRKFSQQEQRQSGGTNSQMGNNVADTENIGRFTDKSNEWPTPHPNGSRISGQSINTKTSQKVRQGGQSIKEIGNYRFIGGWDSFPTQSPICSRNDGISSHLDGITFSKWRNESIKAAGNAIVPQVVLQIFKAIELFNQQNPIT
jgi:DNA (cytosine-5)-methyltransferase 1